MYQKDLVSIVIPCYNCEKYIEKCLNSLLNQTYKKIEIIVVNDGSTDNTLKILEDYKSKFKKEKMNYIIINQLNKGQASAVNNGFKKVTGEFLCWQDSDDYFELDAIENLYNYLINNPDFQLVRGNVAMRNQNNINKIMKIGKSEFPTESNIFDFYLLEKDSYCFAGIFMTRMKHFDNCVIDREIYTSRAGQNWQIILPIAFNSKCGYIDKVVYNYRVLDNSHSHSVISKKDIYKRFNAHKEILIKTINNINMKKSLYVKYRMKIFFKYLKRKVYFLLKCILKRC